MLNKSQEEQSILPKFWIWDLNCSHMQLMYQQLVVAWLFQVMEKQSLANFLLILLLYINYQVHWLKQDTYLKVWEIPVSMNCFVIFVSFCKF